MVDLLCIHPFADGNGRVARLATTHLLLRSGCGAVRHVSLEQQILEAKERYDGALADSTRGWFGFLLLWGVTWRATDSSPRAATQRALRLQGRSSRSNISCMRS